LYVILSPIKTDVFITTNPPFAIFIPLFVRNRYSVLVYDIYPDIVINYNILSEKSIIVRFWRKLNRKVFKRAQRIYTIGEGMKALLANYVADENITVVPCWSDSDFLKPISKEENIFIRNNKLDNKFLVIYSGNIGFTHDVEVIVHLAANTKREDILYLIIGDGEKKTLIEEMIVTAGLRNIIMMPWQSVDMLPYSLGAADLGVVTLGKGASFISVPSKLYDLMAVGAPILSIASKETEMAKLIEKYQIGLCCTANEIDRMLTYIYKLVEDKKFYLSQRENSYKASKYFTSANATIFKI